MTHFFLQYKSHLTITTEFDHTTKILKQTEWLEQFQWQSANTTERGDCVLQSHSDTPDTKLLGSTKFNEN